MMQNCSGLPRLEGTERLLVQSLENRLSGIAVACPDWRGLKVLFQSSNLVEEANCSGLPRLEGTERYFCHEGVLKCLYCSGLPRLEGTERRQVAPMVQDVLQLQWLAPIGGD